MIEPARQAIYNASITSQTLKFLVESLSAVFKLKICYENRLFLRFKCQIDYRSNDWNGDYD